MRENFLGRVVEVTTLPFTYSRQLREGEGRAMNLQEHVMCGTWKTAYAVPPILVAAGLLTQNIGLVQAGILVGATEASAIAGTAIHLRNT